ncbi:putative Ulp1 protease family catalytic domain, papain-like cysteine peptidase superfamily [Arabidopsis thaliana]
MDEDIRSEGDGVHNQQGTNNVSDDVDSPLHSDHEDNFDRGNNAPIDVDLPSEPSLVHDSQVSYVRKLLLIVVNHHSVLIVGDNNLSIGASPSPKVVSEVNAQVSNGDAVEDDLSPGRDVNVEADVNEVRLLIKYWFLFFSPPDLVSFVIVVLALFVTLFFYFFYLKRHDISPVTGAVTSPKLSGDNVEVQSSQLTTTNVDTLANEVEVSKCSQQAAHDVDPLGNECEESQGVPVVSVDSVSNETSAELPDIVAFCRGAPSAVSSPRQDYGNVDNVESMRGRRSKRLRTLSNKLDGRFQYDKKTKLLVGIHPLGFDKKHWVALAVDLKCRKIIVLDSNIQRRKDSAIHDVLMPLAVMLPYLFKQATFNPLMSQFLLDPFTIERPSVIPQVTSPLDTGIFSIFLIRTHATGGVPECVDFDVGGLQSEVKKLVSALILARGY